VDDNKIIDFSDFDSNADGYVDLLTVLHSGYAAEHGGADCMSNDYTERIWSHQWQLFGDRDGNNIGPWVSNGNLKVWNYQMTSVLWGRCGDALAQVGAIAHEIGHSLGLPDLADSDGSGKGLGGYCLMSDPWGFDRSQKRPSQLCAWAKMKLGWLNPTTPVTGYNEIGYTEAPSIASQLYKIGDGSFNFPENEYLLIEYRLQWGFDSDLPGTGLLIYHIDESVGTNNDKEGHPWQSDGFPLNGKHYRVALLQADRLYGLERGINSGGARDFFHADYIDQLMPSISDPSEGPFPNTDSYQGGILAHQTGVKIYNISKSGGSTMSFMFLGTQDQSFSIEVTEENNLTGSSTSGFSGSTVTVSIGGTNIQTGNKFTSGYQFGNKP
jgi:M6 family metalloprotease-like protein